MRTIAYNVYACTGWLPQQARPSTPDEVSLQIAAALLPFRPDILTFSEAPEEPIVAGIASRLGLESVYIPSDGNWPGVLFTRFPPHGLTRGRHFAPDRELFTRHGGRILLCAPHGEIAVYSAHLHPHAGESDRRCREISALLPHINGDIAAGRSVLVQGDLNHKPGGAEYTLWESAGLIDTATAHGIGPSETIKANDPQRRIDYIWVAGPLSRRIRQARVITEMPFGAKGDGPAPPYFLSDHLPVLADFEETA